MSEFAMGATSPKGKLELIAFEPRAPGPAEVRCTVLYCGMCHSDCHCVDADWGPWKGNPMVPGHEVVARVEAVGSEVADFKVGDVVGFGPQRGSCGSCADCADGAENVCTKFQGLYDPHFGGYATSITANARFAFKIPEGLPLHAVGPLLCAGVTTYAPLSRHVKRGDRVGIIGIGGLGHMGLQYAAAMGADVWAVSTSAAKEAEARKFGAANFLCTGDAAAVAAAKGSFDFLLCCATGEFPADLYMSLLKPRKTLCLVGLPAAATPIKLSPFSIVGGERRVEGSLIGGTASMKEMLAFSATHKILPQVEVIPLAAANEGFAKILSNAARYRMVLEIQGFAARKAAEGK